VSEETCAVRLSNVSAGYNGTLAIENVSLDVMEGQFVAILGPNGAGKTTLIRVILGLIKPAQGTVEVFGRPIQRLGAERGGIGYVPQTLAVDIGFPITVYETVLMGTYGRVGVARRPTETDRRAAGDAMERMGISDLRDVTLRKLSGGQRQRTFLARALATGARMLLLDEPTTGVDPATSGSLYELLRDLKKQGVTVMLVSHDVGVVATYIDTVACLNRTLVAHGRPEDVMTTDVLGAMYGCDVAFLHHGHVPHIVLDKHND
jgi:zinc transport system ATP-binding protein